LPKSKKPKRDFAKDFLVKIEKIEKLSNHVFEVSVKAPLFAAQTKLGHIFRLQNYHALAKKRGDQILAMEGVTMTALSSNPETGIIKGVMIVAGASTSLIKNFKKNEACIFMGPSGKPTEIAQNKNVLLIGGGRGNLPLAEIAKVHKKEGCKVIFFAGYKKNEFVVRQKEMENCCDEMVFAIEEKPNLKLNKALSRIFHGSVIDALKNYFSQSEEKIEHIFTIGNDQMMHEIAKLRHQNEILAKAPVAITSLNAPMQCMMKGVCSQCLQKRKNEKGEFEYFYSCAQQDQNMDRLDFAHLHNRCEQNSLSEKISKLWVEQI
jgi:NAD(P)H-flavin reductase